jgi:hypothetical protein
MPSRIKPPSLQRTVGLKVVTSNQLKLHPTKGKINKEMSMILILHWIILGVSQIKLINFFLSILKLADNVIILPVKASESCSFDVELQMKILVKKNN